MTRHITNMNAILIIIIIVLPNILCAISQASFLSMTIEPGARANAMGRAYSAVTDDAFAGWWNPGAMAFNRKTQFAGTHTPWLAGAGGEANDMYHEYLGWNQYFDGIGNLGVNITWMDMGSQMQTDFQGHEIAPFHSFDTGAAVSYAYDVIPNEIGVGCNFKLIYSYLGPATGNTDTDGSAFSFAFDFGTKYRDVVPNLDAAIVLQNFGPNVTYVNEAQSDPLPMTFRLGLAYRAIENSMNKIIVSAEMSKILANEDPLFQRLVTGWTNPSFNESIYGAGIEWTYFNTLSLRGGYFYDKVGEITGPSFGAGFQYTFSKMYQIHLDFAMIEGGQLVDTNKVFSVGLNF